MQDDRETMSYKISQYKLWHILEDEADPFDMSSSMSAEIQQLLKPYISSSDNESKSVSISDLEKESMHENTCESSLTEASLREFDKKNEGYAIHQDLTFRFR